MSSFDLLVFFFGCMSFVLQPFFSLLLFLWVLVCEFYSQSMNCFLPFMVISLPSGACISSVDSISYIYPLHNSCGMSEILILSSFAVRSSLKLSTPILASFPLVVVIFSVGALGKAILNLIMQWSDMNSWLCDIEHDDQTS